LTAPDRLSLTCRLVTLAAGLMLPLILPACHVGSAIPFPSRPTADTHLPLADSATLDRPATVVGLPCLATLPEVPGPAGEARATADCFLQALRQGLKTESHVFVDPARKGSLVYANADYVRLVSAAPRAMAIEILQVREDGPGQVTADVSLQMPECDWRVRLTLRQTSQGWHVLSVSTRGDLQVEEHAVVPVDIDTPNHLEYFERIDPVVLDMRRPWREPSVQSIADRANSILDWFGLRLEKADGAGAQEGLYDLYRGDTRILEPLRMVHPPSVSSSGEDFALLVESLNGPAYLVRAQGAEEWDMTLHDFLPAVFAGNDLVWLERDPGETGFDVREGGELVYHLDLQGVQAANPIRAFAGWEGHWVLEAAEEVWVSGESLSEEVEAGRVFGWHVVAGEPLLFLERDGIVRVSYAGRILPSAYEAVVFGRCCEPAAFNVQGNQDMVWFHGRRDGMWYYVEMGVY
jgi:hypothetical protein